MAPLPCSRATEAELRRDRTSVKWVAYPARRPAALGRRDGRRALPGRRRRRDCRDAARRHRLRLGRRGTPRRSRAYAADTWGWAGRPGRRDDRARRHDRLRRAAAAAHRRGRAGRRLVPGLQRVLRLRRRHRPPPASTRPSTPAGRLDPEALRPAFRDGDRARASARHTCCATRRTPPARCTPAPSSRRSRPWPRSTACASSPTRSTPRSCTPGGRGSRPTSPCAGGERGF